MSEPYIGEIRMFAGTFNPVGWEFCEGQLLPIAENETLFQLIGTTYGGDGQETFALPDLRGRIPVHAGTGSSGTTYVQGEMGGVEEVTLTVQQIPVHAHPLVGAAAGANDPNPVGSVLAEQIAVSHYQSSAPTANMPPGMLALTGGSQPHTNLQPFLCVNFIISLFGIFPSPT